MAIFGRFLALLLILFAAAIAQPRFHLSSGDTVVFYGDSITEQRLYTSFVETYTVTRFPEWKIRFVHSGWGGDMVEGGFGGPVRTRLERDVLSYSPTVVTIMLGMNDGRYRPFDQEIANAYAAGMERLVRSLAQEGRRLTLIQPSPFDDFTRKPNIGDGYNKVLVRYGQIVAELALREKLMVADLNGPVVAALEKAKALDAKLAERIIPDRVHPGAAGHLLMAGALLKAWNAPATVTDVEIDGSRNLAARAENTDVTAIWKNNDILTWQQYDRALPMPVDANDATVALVLRASDFTEALNRQMLKVTGLKGDRWRLRIDGDAAGTFTREQLEAGVNLATMDTPMMRQARRVHELTRKHNEIHYLRWRQVQMPLEDEDPGMVQSALGSMDTLEMNLVQKQRQTAQPKRHTYEIAPER